MDQPNDIELAQIKATMLKLSKAVDGVEYAVALTAIETFAATTLALAGCSPRLVDGFCEGIKRAVPKFRAALNGKEQQS